MCLIELVDTSLGQKQDITLKKLSDFIFVAEKVGKAILNGLEKMIGL